MLGLWEKIGLNLILFSKFFGTTTYGTFIFLAINIRNIKLKLGDLLFLNAILVQLLISFFLSDFNKASLSNTYFYFLFFLIYLFLRYKSEECLENLIKYVITVSFIFVLLEFVILNSSLSSQVWYFTETHSHRSEIMGLQRAQGLAAISSSSGAVSILFFSLYALVTIKLKKIFLVMTVIKILLLMSGTGLFLLICYLFLSILKKLGSLLNKIIYIFLIIFFIAFIDYSSKKIGLTKFTVSYLSEIYLTKIDQIQNQLFNKSFHLLVFGEQSNNVNPLIQTSTDFGLLGLFTGMGVYSIILIIFSPFFLIGFQKKYYVVLILYFLSWLHYPVVGSPEGSIFFGIFLAFYERSFHKNNRYK